MVRELQRKLLNPTEHEQQFIDRADKIYHQKRNDKNKIYSVHEKDVYCISKGKAHKRYEFGNKVLHVQEQLDFIRAGLGKSL